VLSDDPTTPGGIEYKQVLQTFAHETNYLVDVYIGGEKITTTENHPFWVKDVGWVAARDLGAGSLLETKTESWLGVERVEKHTEVATVYNFEVQGFHTYFVSDLGLLVHNSCPKVDNILNDLKDNGILNNPKSKANALKPETLQEGNVTLDLGDGRTVNIRVETHPLTPGGEPVRHANVQEFKPGYRGKNQSVSNEHITE
jgi:Pretoxin HINT domain